MVGLPGSGKDTFIKNNLKEFPTISRDDIRKEIGIQGEKPIPSEYSQLVIVKT